MSGECPPHREGLNVTVTERHTGLQCSTKHCTLQPGHPGGHEPTVIDVIANVLRQHHAYAGVMASPTHWAYRGDWLVDHSGKPWRPDRDTKTETPGHWYAHCGVGNGHPGCDWDSEPTTYQTKDEAYEVALLHVAVQVAEAVL